VKKTCAQREPLPSAGFKLKNIRFDRIYIGAAGARIWVYAGKVESEFDSASAKELQARLTPLPQNTSLRQENPHKGIWVKLKLLTEVEYGTKGCRRRECAIHHSKAFADSSIFIKNADHWRASTQ
jgi:bifunctional non-homologous end joining protein LigD